ncbi:MAG: putative E3 ubiquitin-protein ligase HUWE1 [Streblomastix strix]|uniref:HECT-type E3 ubiquitin transferase n=1 Tax=Streblomastix strix TaxID=222440 RepID=A0A5J4U643_9EUKA|nr:MAG: putative E3 ubiquitin-protein ligase HUWE1 [Streblomastix strix]
MVTNMTDEDRAKLLQFVTGTTRLPSGGFQRLIGSAGMRKFTICKAQRPLEYLPYSHTCFNQIDMPEYPTFEVLQERFNTALREGSKGFYDR